MGKSYWVGRVGLLLLLTIANISILFIFGVPALQAQTTDPGIRDTIRIGCPAEVSDVSVGDSIAVPVFIWADQDVSAFGLGFHYDRDGIRFSSWKVGPTIPTIGLKLTTNRPEDEPAHRFGIGWIDFTSATPIHPTPSGAALLGTLYFRVLSQQFAGDINLDSIFVPPALSFTLVTSGGSNMHTPVYKDCGEADILVGELSCTGVYPCGDFDHNERLDIADVVLLINYIFGGGAEPPAPVGGDADCSERTDVADAVFMINYVFAAGPSPCLGCYESPIIDRVDLSPSLIYPGDNVTIAVTALEPTGALLKYHITVGDFDHTGFSNQTHWQVPLVVRDYQCTVSVTDGCETDSTTFTIHVYPTDGD